MNSNPAGVPEGLPADPLASLQPDRTTMRSTPDVERTAAALRFFTASAALANSKEYLLRRQIGRGGFGEIWEAEQTSLGRIIAVKRIREELYENAAQGGASDLDTLFCQEAMTAAILDHPNILPIHDLGIDENGRPLLAMKLVRGRPWTEIIFEDFYSLSASDFLVRHLPILHSTAQALAFAHSRGIVHRDVKPSQVMVGEFGEVLLMDWGLAVCFDEKVLAQREAGIRVDWAPTLDSASNPAGTVAYMAPEQTQSTASGVGPWTDVYLLGGTLYHLLTGKAPHTGADPVQVFFHASTGNVAPARQAAPDRWMPDELVALAEHALQAERDARLETAQQFCERIQDYITGSSRKRQSAELCLAAKSDLAGAGEDYGRFEKVLSTLRQARDLWPQNPDLAELLPAASDAYARAALANNDLVLARLQAQRVVDEAKRQELLALISAGEKARLRRGRIRRSAVVTVIVLLLVIIGMGTSYHFRVKKERDAAREARAKSEKLAQFMLLELRTQLEPLGKIELLDKAAQELLAHYKSMDTTGLTSSELKDIYAGLVNIAIIYGDSQAKQETSREALDAARVITGTRYNKTHETDWASYHADVLERLARVETRTGNMKEGIVLIGEAIEILEDVLKVFPKEATTARGKLVDYYARRSGYHDRSGDRPAALRDAENSLKQAELFSRARPDDKDLWLKLYNSRQSYGSLLWNEGQNERAYNLMIENIRMVSAIDEKEPDNLPVSMAYARCCGAIAGVLEDLGRMPEAESYANTRISLAQRYLEKSPSNTAWMRERALGHRWIARVALSNDDFDKAKTHLDEALPIHLALLERDPENTTWILEELYCQSDLAKVDMNHGDAAAALERFLRIEQGMGKLAESDPANKTQHMQHLDSMSQVADALQRLDRHDEAIEWLMKARTELLKLPTGESSREREHEIIQRNLKFLVTSLKAIGKNEEAEERQKELDALDLK